MTRHIAFDGIENFRDFGGYDTACGRGLKRGVLYRSANHAYASEADLKKLRELEVAVVVDLRRPREREREPSRRFADFAGQVIENHEEGEHHDWADQMPRYPVIDVEWFRRDSLEFYRNAVHSPRHVDLFRRYFRALAQAPGPVVVHCAAGKDRTGMICAFTQQLAGVHPDDIMADYLATNDENRIAERVAFLGPYIEKLTGHVVAEGALRLAVSVRPEYLHEALAEIARTHDTMERYLAEVLGVDTQARGQILDHILA
jgi:protein-tyrosine phosphatase